MKKANGIFKTALLALTLCVMASACAPKENQLPTTKKGIMDAFVAGTLPESYAPAAFFVHFASNQKVGMPAVNAHLQFLLKTNADILKVQFEQRVQRVTGDLNEQETWDNIGPIPVDFYRPTVEIIKNINEIAGKDVYVSPTVYSAYQVARQALGDDNIAKAAAERPEDLKRVLGYYLEALEWYVQELKNIGIESFYMTTQGGEMKYNSIPGFYSDIIKPFDLKLMNQCQEGAKLTLLHICDWEGTYDDLTRYLDYPGDIVNVPLALNGTPVTLSDAEKLFGRPVLGGFDRKGHVINKGSEEEVAAVVKEAIANGPKGRVMIGADCTVSDAPIKNIHAAISAAHNSAE